MGTIKSPLLCDVPTTCVHRARTTRHTHHPAPAPAPRIVQAGDATIAETLAGIDLEKAVNRMLRGGPRRVPVAAFQSSI
jgi:FXSXX-COOH protein